MLAALSLLASPAIADDLGSVPEGAARITAADVLHDLLVDATMFGSFPQFGDEKWSEYYCRNGSALYVVGNEKERGRWWIAESEACFQYSDRDPVCYATYSLGDGAYFMRSDARDIGVAIHGRAQGDIFSMQKLSGMACEDLSS